MALVKMSNYKVFYKANIKGKSNDTDIYYYNKPIVEI